MHASTALHQRKEKLYGQFTGSELGLTAELDIVMRNRQVVALTGIEAPYPALSDWAVQTFIDCQKNQELQGEVYSTIARSINKHTGKDTVTILRDIFLTAFNRRKSGRSL